MALLVVLLPVLVLGAVALAVRAAAAGEAVPPEAVPAARSTGRWRLAGVAVGLVVAGVSASAGGLGRGVLLAAPLFGLCAVLGVVVGELRVPRPSGPTRSAGLDVRTVRDYLPRGLALAVATATALLVALLAITTALGSPDDLGRAGRSLAAQCSVLVSERRGPWPGSFYSLPLAVVVLTGLVVAALALTRVVGRPRTSTSASVDDALRRRAATAVTAAVGLLVTVPLAGVATTAASALLGVCAPPAGGSALGRGLLLVAPGAVLLGVWCGAVLLVPGAVRTTAPVRR